MVWKGHDGDCVGWEKMEGATDMVTIGRDHETDKEAWGEGSGVGPSSVRVGVRGGVANREFWGGLVTAGGCGIVVG